MYFYGVIKQNEYGNEHSLKAHLFSSEKVDAFMSKGECACIASKSLHASACKRMV